MLFVPRVLVVWELEQASQILHFLVFFEFARGDAVEIFLVQKLSFLLVILNRACPLLYRQVRQQIL